MSVNTDPVPARAEYSDVERAWLDERLQQARQGKKESPGPRLSIPRRAAGGELPISFAQERLWFLDQLEPGSAVYNVCQAARLEGALNVAALQEAFNAILRRHEILRTNFVCMDGEPAQVIAAERSAGEVRA